MDIKIATNDTINDYYIRANNQNSLKGLCWCTGAAVEVGFALSSTGLAIATVASTILGRSLAESIIPGAGSWMVVGSLLSAGISYVLVKHTATCFSNAIYHLGPKYQIVSQAKPQPVVVFQ